MFRFAIGEFYCLMDNIVPDTCRYFVSANVVPNTHRVEESTLYVFCIG